MALNPIISEIEAGNKAGIVDAAGVPADWLEIYNPDPQQAVNLSGWALNYAKNNTTWAFPGNTMLGPGEFRVIFCDAAPTTNPLGELHTSFNLSKNGSTVNLLNGSNIVSSLTYPALNSDTSYGPGETVTETKIVAAGATAKYYAPTNDLLGATWTQSTFSDSSWSSGSTGLGFANTVNGFAVTVYKSSLGSVANIATANEVINTPADQSWTQTETAPYVNYMNTGGGGEFSTGNTNTGQTIADRTYPGMTINADVDYYVMQATGTITIPAGAGGPWTFCANTDDGFSATIGGSTFKFDGLRGASDSLYTINLAAGTYPVTFMQFENGGGSSAEFSAAQGTKTAFDSTFRLVGDTANGGLKVSSAPFNGITSNSGAFAAAIATNVKPAVQSAMAASGNGTSLYTRIKFDTSTYAVPSTLTLKMQYDDGYVAYLNGVKIASANAPSAPTWNSVASEERSSDIQSTTFANVDLTPYIGSITPKAVTSLTSSGTTATVTLPNHGFANGDTITIAGASPSQYNGNFVISHVTANTFTYTISSSAAPATGTITACRKTNVLAVQVLLSTNALSTDGDLLVVPELSQITSVVGVNHVFSTPTPGAANALGNVQPDVSFSTKHGFFYAPFQVTLASNIAGSSIRYTTDNSVPTAAVAGAAKAIASITYGGLNNLTATVTCAGHGFYTGNQVQISGAAQPQYNGVFNITVLSANTFSYTMGSAPAANASGAMTAANIPVGTVGSTSISGISYGGNGNTTATVTAAGHGFFTGQQIEISGAAQWQYDGVFSITVVDANTFTYTMSAAPGAIASGSMSAAAVSTLAYTGPIRISTTTDLRAVIVVSGTAGPAETESYIFPVAVAAQPAAPAGFPTTWNGVINNESTAADYAMSPVPGYTTQQVIDALSALPTMSLVTTNDSLFGGSGIYSNSDNRSLEVPGSFEYFDPNNTSADYGARVGLQMFGGVGRNPPYKKHSFAVCFDQSNGPSSMGYDLFGDGYKATRLILRHGFNDGWAWGGANAQYVIDSWTRDALTELGTQNTPGVWVQVFVNGLYWGLYNAVAHVDNNFAAHFYGGQPADYDIIHVGSGFTVVAGNTAAWTAMFNLARTGTIDGSGGASPTALADSTAYALMAQYLNLPAFCDYIITNFYGGNWDWDWHNYTAIYSRTAGTGFLFADWDGEGMLQDPNTNITSRNTAGGPTELFVQLLANPDFRTMFADHIYRDLNGVLSPTNAAAMYQQEAGKISQAIIDESARWGDITGTQYTPASWNARLNWELGTYFPTRTATMLAQFQNAVAFAPDMMYPSFDPPTLRVNGAVENGGTFTPGNVLTMEATTGAIYYTTDGSDPQAGGGGIGATALAYSGAITLTQGVEIKTRVYSGGAWSALNDAPFYVNLAPSIRITELMYNPAPATADEINRGYTDTGNGAQDFEFVELQNIGSSALPLQGLSFTNGISFTFPKVTLGAGEYIVVASDPAAFAIRYDPQTLLNEYGATWLTSAQYTGHFNNGGEKVTLNAPNGGEILSFTFSNTWYPQTDGGGFGLMVRSANQPTSLWNSSAGWESGGTPNGTPAAAETVAIPLPDSIVVNEVLSHTSTAPGDMIEFYNTTAQPIDISGWFVSDSTSNLAKYEIAAGAVIAAHGYFVLSEDYNFGALATGDLGRLVAFGLSEHGDDVYLSNNYAGKPGGYREHQAIDSELNGFSRGLYAKSTGGTDFTLLQTPTFGTRIGNTWSGGANSIPYVSPLVTDEIMYSPAAPTLAESQAGYATRDFEYVEVYNRSSSPVALGNYYLAGGIGYTPGWLADGNLANNFTAAGITLSGTTATVTLNSTVTGFQNGDRIHIDGAAQIQYNGDFVIANLTVNAAAATTTFTYTLIGSPVSPATPMVGQVLTAGKDSEFQTLESGATATWSATGLASASYTVYAHVNLYDGDNGLRSDLDSTAQYTITYGGTSTTVPVSQNQIPATLSVSSLTYNNLSGLVTATAGNAFSAGSIVHISGAAQAQYNGAFVVQSATSSMFTYALAPQLGLTAATGTITAGLNDAWISLGTFALNGAVSVQLVRTADAKAGEWTVAGALELVTGQQATLLSGPVLNSYSMQHPVATLAPGAYAVLVANYAAFDSRNHVAANNILVLGGYSGHLNNGGDTVDIYQVGNRDDGSVAPLNGSVPSYRVDHVNFNNATPWPMEPDGNGPALVRVHTADYGNDAINWQASNAGGTPSKADIVIDKSAPSVPTSLAGQTLLSPTSAIRLTWTASLDLQSGVDHYVIYRNGSAISTATASPFVDSTISVGKNYTYAVTAVNRDGYESAPSVSIGIGLPWVISKDEPNATQIEIFFSEPLTPAVASQAANYTVTGMTISSVALSRDNTKLTLTLASPMVVGTAYTVTMKNLTTVSGNALPATQTFTFNFANQGTGSILWEYYGNIGGGTAITDLTSASIYPNNPTQTDLETSFEAPHDFADSYGERLRGYLYPPTTGYYVFTIASDDNGQLWLSSDDNPANIVQIASVDSWTGYRDWANTNNPNQTSIPIYLTAGRRYYVEALQKEGAGGDNLSVRWEIPATTGGDATTWELNSSGLVDSTIPIPGIRLAAPTTLLDTTPPPAPVNLRATVTGSNIGLAWSPVLGLPSGVDHYNIYRDGTLYATSATASYLDASTSRHSYQVAAVNFDAVIGAKSIAVSASPAGLAAIVTPTSTTVEVQFSEPVDPATAQTVGNYSITNSNCTISAAVLQADGYTVLLTTSALGASSHTLTVSNVKTKNLSALPSPLTSIFSYASAGWSATLYSANFGMGNLASAQSVVTTPGYQNWSQTFQPSTINFRAGSTNPGDWGYDINDALMPTQTSQAIEWDNYVIAATGTLNILTAGTYTFDVPSDDGFRLTIPGATFTALYGATNASNSNWMAYDGGRGTSDTLGVVYLNAGYYPISLLYFQGGGPSSVEVWASLDPSGSGYSYWNSSFALVGDTANGGLSLGGSYIPPSFVVGVNPKSTSDTSPSLSGTVTDPTASVAVRVNGSYYAAANNGDGTWSLPRGDISALSAGSYDVVVAGVSQSGTAAFDSTRNELNVDLTLPTVSITSPASPTITPLSSIDIQFSEPVTNFSLQNLQLLLANGGPTASEPLEGATLATTDNQKWTVGNLAGLTTAAGAYSLTLFGQGSAIADLSGNPLVTNAPATWTMSNPAVVSINRVGSASVTNASSVQYLVTFNRNVTNVLTTDFTLATSGVAGTIAQVSGNGAVYTVTVNNISGNGTLGLNLVDGNSILDVYNNPLGGPIVGDGSFTGQLFTIDKTGPTVTTAANATPNVVTGLTSNLSVRATDIATGEPSLIYTWAATTLPSGASPPAFGPATNGTNAAKDITATFSKSGTYRFTVTITAPVGLTTASSVTVTVSQTLKGITVSPATVSLTAGGNQQFTVVGQDQFGQVMASPAATWSLTGPGNLSGSGMYTPPYMGGAATVQASSAGFNGTGSVTFTGQAQWNSAANADWNASGSWKDTISGATIAAPGLRGIEGDTLLFASATGGTISLDGQSPTVASIAFNNAATSYTVAQGSGGSVLLAGSSASVAVYAGNHWISAPLGLAANTTFAVASGSSLTVTRPVSGNGGLVKNGGGKLELSAANLYTGGTTVTAGILEVGNSAGLLDGSSLTVSAGGLFSFDSPVDAVAVQPSATASTRLVSMPRLATSPGPQAIVHGESLSANGLTTPTVDPVIWLRSASLPAPLDKGNGGHVRNLAWLGLAASRTDQADSMDQSNKKVRTLLALEAVFAQYGL